MMIIRDRTTLPFMGTVLFTLLVASGMSSKPLLRANLRAVPAASGLASGGDTHAAAVSSVIPAEAATGTGASAAAASGDPAPTCAPTAVSAPAAAPPRRLLTVVDAEGLRAALLPARLFASTAAGRNAGVDGRGGSSSDDDDDDDHETLWPRGQARVVGTLLPALPVTILVDAARLEVSAPLVIPAGADVRIVATGASSSASGSGRANLVARDTSLFEVRGRDCAVLMSSVLSKASTRL